MTEAANKNRQLLLLIAGLPLIMVLLASWLWFYVASGDIDLVAWLGTANRGELLSPALPLKDLQLTDHAGQPVYPFVGAPRWRILIPGAGQPVTTPVWRASAERPYFPAGVEGRT